MARKGRWMVRMRWWSTGMVMALGVVGLVTPAAGAATPTTTPVPTAATTLDPRATGSRPAFAPKAPGALPRPVISRGVTNDPASVLATSLAARLNAGESGAVVVDVRKSLAAVVAARTTTATATELDAAWAKTTPQRLQVIATALAQVGRPYTWLGADPATGFDCSGLVLYAWSSVGVKLPHNSEQQLAVAQPVTPEVMQPGDITHYPNHVSIYLGVGRAIVHAEQASVPVRITDWSTSVREYAAFA